MMSCAQNIRILALKGILFSGGGTMRLEINRSGYGNWKHPLTKRCRKGLAGEVMAHLSVDKRRCCQDKEGSECSQ